MPETDGVIDADVEPSLQVLPNVEFDVKVAVCPEHIELPEEVIVGVTGKGNTFTVNVDELEAQEPLPVVTE